MLHHDLQHALVDLILKRAPPTTGRILSDGNEALREECDDEGRRMALAVIGAQLPDVPVLTLMDRQRNEDNRDHRQPPELRRDALFAARLEAIRGHFPAEFLANATNALKGAMALTPSFDDPCWNRHNYTDFTASECEGFARAAYVHMLEIACEVMELLLG